MHLPQEIVETHANILFQTLKKKDKSGLILHAAPMTTWQVTTAPGVPLVLFTYALVMLLAYAYTAGT